MWIKLTSLPFFWKVLIKKFSIFLGGDWPYVSKRNDCRTLLSYSLVIVFTLGPYLAQRKKKGNWFLSTKNVDREGGGSFVLEIHTGGGVLCFRKSRWEGVKKWPHPSGGADIFWNNPIREKVHTFFKLTHLCFSAGCGRTGTIIAVDYAWTLLQMKVSNDNTWIYTCICRLN